MSHPVLFIPGPVEIDPELRQIMAMPAIGHRSQAAKDCVQRVCAGLKSLLRTTQHAYFETGPATALMEATIRNLVQQRVLHVTAGAFGERWAKISAACGREPHSITADWGTTVDAARLRATLKAADEPYEAVCITHSETSTGVLAPLAALAATVREHSPDTLVLVDVVTSLGGVEFRFDDWGIDAAFAGTQKCLALPPGLCVFGLSDRAIARSATIPGRGFLLDFAATPARFQKAETPATPCVPLMFALARQLERIADETLDARTARHLALRDRTIAWAEAAGFEPFVSDPDLRSPTVSALCADAERITALITAAKTAGFTISKGYGKIATETFRIGHMGDHDMARLERLLGALDSVPA